VDIKSVSRRGVALAAAVLTLGLATGAAASTSLALAEQDAISAALELRTASVRSALDKTFQRYADTMHDLVAAAATQPGPALSPTVARLVGERLDGAHGVLVVTADHKITAQHAVDGSTPPATATFRPEPELAGAMALSHDLGRLVAGPAHVLPADRNLPPAHRQLAFELAEPVHTDTAFLGWVIVSVRGGDLLEQSLRTAGVTGVAASLAEVSPAGVTHEVARWSEGGPATGTAGRTVDVALAGHAWQILIRPTGDLVSTGRAAADRLTLLAAALVSTLLATIVLTLDAGRNSADARARRAADDRLAGLERAHRAEQTLREREAELTGFAATAGAKLHAPLHTIAGFTDLLLEDTSPQLDDQSRGFLDRIAGSTRRMLTVVDELLAYTATIDVALKLEPVHTGRLAVDVAAARLDAGDGERPSIDVGDLPVVTADAELLGRVLDQLVGNAVRFVRHGAAARVTVSASELPSGWYRFEVADRGIGVPEEHRDRIFAPFHRTPTAEGYAGSGLGLAVCKRIIALHGGEIGMRPNPGGGSIFWFTVSATGVTLSAGDLSTLASV
jgi:signal transduction histidine kinase